ncbi:hypothetical protein HWV62_41388 [Athelia sp. TMB]|nr:hypothetical protein HWV62_41388 [Athelia sp. TMB]
METVLDEETDQIPRSDSQKTIELKNIKASDFEILLDYLNLGTRYDKQPLAVADWASIIVVCSRFGMQRVLDHACKALLCQDIAANCSSAGVGFERDTYGMYFLIREKTSGHCLSHWFSKNTEGVQLHLWPLKKDLGDKSQVFFVDGHGALHHALSGLAVDIVDDVPILRRHRPVSSQPNPWSHPLPEFSFVNSQIRVRFLSNPSLPSCADDLYPQDAWATKDFVLGARPEKNFHMHSISDFSPWIPVALAGSFPYENGALRDKKWRVLVEERKMDIGDERTSWEIVPVNKVDFP